MKKVIIGGLIVCLMLIISCDSSKESTTDITGFYECEYDETKYELSLYEDSTFMQSMLNKIFGEIQSNGKYILKNDTLCLIDEYYISNGQTVAVKDYEQSLSESEKNRKFKLISYDGNNLIMRDLRSQRVNEYHKK